MVPTTAERTRDRGVDLSSPGFDAVDHEITRLIRQASARGAAPTLVAVLADQDAPVVARQRAFARIATWLNS